MPGAGPFDLIIYITQCQPSFQCAVDRIERIYTLGLPALAEERDCISPVTRALVPLQCRAPSSTFAIQIIQRPPKKHILYHVIPGQIHNRDLRSSLLCSCSWQSARGTGVACVFRRSQRITCRETMYGARPAGPASLHRSELQRLIGECPLSLVTAFTDRALRPSL